MWNIEQVSKVIWKEAAHCLDNHRGHKYIHSPCVLGRQICFSCFCLTSVALGHIYALCVGNAALNKLAPYKTDGQLFATNVCAKFKVI